MFFVGIREQFKHPFHFISFLPKSVGSEFRSLRLDMNSSPSPGHFVMSRVSFNLILFFRASDQSCWGSCLYSFFSFQLWGNRIVKQFLLMVEEVTILHPL